VLHLLFDPLLPFHANLIVDFEAWADMALLTVRGFRQANRFCEHEPWYRDVVDRLMPLPHFAAFWRQAALDQPTTDPSAGVVFATILPVLRDPTRSARLRPLLVSAGYFQFDFPRIIGFIPADEATQAIFARLGLPLPREFQHEHAGHFVP
jgi:hypothetical protein